MRPQCALLDGITFAFYRCCSYQELKVPCRLPSVGIRFESRPHHATTASNTFLNEMESENPSSEKQCGMELLEYLFDPDQGIWRGQVKAEPKHQVSGESFEVLQGKLRQLRLKRCR